VAFHSDGYGIAVTPLQMAAAFNVIASGGYFIPPTIIKQPAGRGLDSLGARRILSPSTVHKLTTILTQAVNRGTGKKARINGIDIAGKTGTAKKLKNGKFQKIYVSSFGGFFPANRPRITILVVIDEPVGLYYGGDVAAPLFRSIAEKIMVYLKIFPELDTTNEVRI
jgi:cell division protein FtsI/penicillin-binding protein 2